MKPIWEKYNAQIKAYREANSEKNKANNKTYREANPEKRKANQKTWYETNREKLKAKYKAYREANREKQRNWQKAWHKANPEKARAATHKRRAYKRQVPYIPITRAIQLAMYEAQDGRCYYGGEPLNGVYELEHKIPLSRGGHHMPDNIVLACKRCNGQKHIMTDAEFLDRPGSFCPLA